MKLTFTERGWEDYLWFQANERKLLKKINSVHIKKLKFEWDNKKNKISTEPQINRYFTAKRREASRLYETANCRFALLRVSNYK
ncbi:MAG: hypothetical protein VSS75_011215 [Candidatus Parabeggiatoa sp.]|nr:hypothetical protein [Candidatus Parabeggiatoa sp.]